MIATRRARVLLLAVLAMLAACATRGRNSETVAREETTVTVQNQAVLDMTMYVLRSGGGSRIRLGLVNGNSQQTFRIPESIIGLGQPLSFVADPIGNSNTAQSFEIYVRPGDNVRLTIPPQVGRF
ncbi:MAG TPA: hypothetical protein VFX98_13710 [Longimicrobiaceae bacterium]|nr:hypothetical protein [Longimicrobiaceae bacterium]